MSKIGNYNMELEEELRDQLNELGFESLQDALNAGYVVTEHVIGGIPMPVLWKIPTPINREEEQKAYEEAHEAWLKEKEEVIKGLESCLATSECSPACDIDIERAIKFIKEAHE